jgi:predicted DNA-binding transcriptional regulator YafY
MFGGDEINVKLRFNNQIIRAVIDRFGKDVIMVPDSDDHFTITVRIVISPVFFGWLFQFGELCEVLEPLSLIDELLKHSDEFTSKLKKSAKRGK